MRGDIVWMPFVMGNVFPCRRVPKWVAAFQRSNVLELVPELLLCVLFDTFWSCLIRPRSFGWIVCRLMRYFRGTLFVARFSPSEGTLFSGVF
jgi:hypothetical protein